MIKWKENAHMLFYVERSRHADLDFTALRGKYCSCKKPKKENKCCCLLILNPSSSLHRSVIPAQSYRPEKKNIYNSFEWNLICSLQLQHESCKRPKISSKHFSLTETRLSMLQIINNLQLFSTTNCQHPVLKWFHMSFLFKAPKYSRYSCNNYVTDPQL